MNLDSSSPWNDILLKVISHGIENSLVALSQFNSKEVKVDVKRWRKHYVWTVSWRRSDIVLSWVMFQLAILNVLLRLGGSSQDLISMNLVCIGVDWTTSSSKVSWVMVSLQRLLAHIAHDLATLTHH